VQNRRLAKVSTVLFDSPGCGIQTNVATLPGLTHRRPHLLPAPIRKPRLNPLALWHLLSLDAPTVAALWTWFIARANHVPLPATSVAAMAIAVWLLYAADRLLDARTLHGPHLEARHHFHHRHRAAFMLGIAMATLALAILLPALSLEALRLYLVEGSFLVGYFILIHATGSAHRLPKELAVGLFFAAATFIPTISRVPALRLPLLLPAILFAGLCSLNCLFIYAWEHPASRLQGAHPATQLALRYLQPLAFLVMGTAVTLTFLDVRVPRRLLVVIVLSTALLLTLHRFRHAFSSTTLRAAADLVLLTPLLFLI
jgi:hypothetical protein